MKNGSSTPLFKSVTFSLLLLFLLGLFYLMARPFLVSLLLAMVAAGTGRWLYHFFYRITGKRSSLSSLAALVTLVGGFLVPLGAAFVMLFSEGLRFFQTLPTAFPSWVSGIEGVIAKIGRRFPQVGQKLSSSLQDFLPKAVEQTAQWALQLLNSGSQEVASLLLQLLVFFFALYYFFIDWEEILLWIDGISPLDRRHNIRLYREFLSMARAILRSTLVVGAIQGILGGLLFALMGVSSPIFWGFVMFIFSVLPLVGTGLVWAPVGIVKLLSGSPLQGIFILLFGALVLGNVDNLLRPRLVGKDTALHPLIVFISSLGGIGLFGFSGFLLGPLLAALLGSLLETYRKEMKPRWLGLKE